MRTVRYTGRGVFAHMGCLPRGVSAQGGVCPGGLSAQGRESAQGGVSAWGVCPGGVCRQGCLLDTRSCEQNHRCKNNTLPQLRCGR